ncbi:hypothetical protein KY347_06650 [Candidatus Woesearchaeota archaeon]|nr:hypothetical protein [Candidatus Woesearchaeota archaeon]
MKKRGVFLVFPVILLLTLIPPAYSIYEELVYSETVEDKDVVNISGSIFEFRIDPASSKVYVEIDVSAVIVSAWECKIKDKWDICIENISFSYRNYTAYYDVYKALVEVYQIKSNINLTSTMGQENLLIGEETNAELAIGNSADIVAENVTAAVNIPPNLFASGVEGCKRSLGNIIFTGEVYPGQIKKCTYNLKALSGGDFELAANATYFDGIEKKSLTSNKISGKVYNYSLEIEPKFNKSSFDINEKFNLTIKIENTNDDYDLSITNLNIKIPEGLLLLKNPRDTSGNSKLRSWSGNLASKENKTFLLELQGLRTGNYSVLTKASYKIGKFFRTAENKASIEVYCNCPFISHEFSQQIAVPDQRISLKAFLSNPSRIHDFSDVKIDYATDIPDIQDFSATYPRIKPYESIKIFDSPIITPPINEIYHFNITAVYESPADQVFIVRDNIVIKIPVKEEEIAEEDAEEEIEAEAEQQETEEQESSEEVALGAEESEEETPVQEEENISSDELPSTTLAGNIWGAIKPYKIIVYIIGIILVLVAVIIIKRKKKDRDMEKILEQYM